VTHPQLAHVAEVAQHAQQPSPQHASYRRMQKFSMCIMSCICGAHPQVAYEAEVATPAAACRVVFKLQPVHHNVHIHANMMLTRSCPTRLK
jgi:hypothetical protein